MFRFAISSKGAQRTGGRLLATALALAAALATSLVVAQPAHAQDDSNHREVTETADCTTWRESSTGSFDPSRHYEVRVAMRCDRMAAHVKVRGVLDIPMASDKHTPWTQADQVGQTFYSGWYGGNQSVKTRIETGQIADAINYHKTDEWDCITVLQKGDYLAHTKYRVALSCSYIAPGVMVQGNLDAVNQTDYFTDPVTDAYLNTTFYSNWLTLPGVNIRGTNVVHA